MAQHDPIIIIITPPPPPPNGGLTAEQEEAVRAAESSHYAQAHAMIDEAEQSGARVLIR